MRSPFPARPLVALRALVCVVAAPGIATAIATGIAPGIATAEEPARATAKVECARASEPGRVRCEIEARVPAGTVLRWADVVVTRSPPFASPLRARVGPLEASAHEDTVWRWAIALAARGRGSGELAARVRIVACVRAACAPTELEAKGEVVVGE